MSKRSNKPTAPDAASPDTDRAAVQAAEAVVARLRGEIAGLEKRKEAIDALLERDGYLVEVEHDERARIASDELIIEKLALDGNVKRLTGALKEAERRLVAARDGHARAADQANARREREVFSVLVGHLRRAGEGLALFADASSAARAVLVGELYPLQGERQTPRYDAFVSMLERAAQTALAQSAAKHTGRTLAPSERRYLDEAAEAWRRHAEIDISRRLGEEPQHQQAIQQTTEAA
jgi:hypothetical protein